jgi:hypothetical protein
MLRADGRSWRPQRKTSSEAVWSRSFCFRTKFAGLSLIKRSLPITHSGKRAKITGEKRNTTGSSLTGVPIFKVISIQNHR